MKFLFVAIATFIASSMILQAVNADSVIGRLQRL